VEEAQPSTILGRSWKLGTAWTAALLGLLALLVSSVTLGRESLWFDETVTVRVGRMVADQFAELVQTREPFWALYYAMMRAWMMIGDSAVLLRLPSALAAAATVSMTYLVGRRLVGERAAVAGALVLVFHAFLLQYAQEARGYALAVALVVAATLAFVRACEKPNWWRWALYAILGIAAVYAHFFAGMVLASHALALALWPRLRHGRVWVYPVASFLVMGLATWPLASWLLAAEQTRNFVRPISIERLIAVYAWFGGANSKPAGALYFLLAAAAFVGITVACIRLVRITRAASDRWRPALLLAWVVFPFVLTVAISLTVKPVFTYRYLIVSLPAVALAIGLVLTRLERPRVRRLSVLLAGVVLSVGASSILLEMNKPDWNGAARFVLRESRPGDVVMSSPGWQWTPLQYAFDQANAGHVPERREIRPRRHHAEAVLDRLRREGSRIWLVLFDYYAVPHHESYPYLDLLESTHRRLVDEVFYNARVLMYEPILDEDAVISGPAP
jgi:mannosyltransferase